MADRSTGAHLTTALFYGAVILLAYLVFRVFEPFLVPLGWAGVLVVVFYPLHRRLERRMRPNAAASISTLGVTLILIVPVLLLMALFVREGLDAARGVQESMTAGQFSAVERIWQWLRQHSPIAESTGSNANLSGIVQRYAEQAAAFLASKLGAVLRNVALFLFELFVTLFALFYFFRDADSMMKGIRRLLPFEPPQRERILSEARELINASVTASLIIAAVQGLLGGVAFAIVGLHTPVFWGVVMAFCSLLPVIGSAIVWGPAAIWLLATGHAWRAVVLALICAGLVGTVDNFLRPLLISGRSRLNGLWVFISAFGGIAVFGMLGLVLGPIVVATAASVLESYPTDDGPG
jgi:predicted PurR-regulated permease PerM